ncbi:MAG: aminomethyl-transferring glycine dehydrogenase subunit GcvPB [Cytophagales bacterium]|nr:aminomethyl-transferring glycine dehydrogenase subunit GcvPB [Cytophagales bacterium]
MRNFHQAKWDEEIIFQLHNPGEKGLIVNRVETQIEHMTGDGISEIPESMLREQKPGLPEIGQMRVLKHFLRLSQQNLGADFNIDVGQGTCTIKYNPKINECFVRDPRESDVHPMQDESTCQGTLQMLYEMHEFFKEISGLDRFSFQPSSGSHAILNMASILRKYHEDHVDGHQRDELITTIFSHPSDAAAAKVLGFKIITLHQEENGLPSVEALKRVVSERTAGLFITNPEDTGIYNPDIDEFTAIVHEAGGLCGYDQANANGILGITRAKEAGFDMCFFNLHKTFSGPHGSGGPAAGVLGVTKKLQDYLAVPVVDKREDGTYFLNFDLAHSIGKTRQFYGPIPVIVRAYAWIRSLGVEGLEEVARIAVLNNNYLLSKITKIRGASSPYSAGKHRIEQVRYSWDRLYKETGVGTHDVALRMADFGFHMWSSHHPFIVPEPFTIEPTESYSKEELDEYIEGLQRISDEAYATPEIVKRAPHHSVVHRVDHSVSDDPEKWAITWRAYLRKHRDRLVEEDVQIEG